MGLIGLTLILAAAGGVYLWLVPAVCEGAIEIALEHNDGQAAPDIDKKGRFASLTYALNVRRIANSSTIEIRLPIANQITEYRAWRLATRRNLIERNISTLDQQKQKLESQVREAQRKFDDLRIGVPLCHLGEPCVLSKPELDALTEKHRPYYDAKLELDKLQRDRDAVSLQLMREKIELLFEDDPGFRFRIAAQPPTRPIAPKTFIVALLFVAAAVSGVSGVYLRRKVRCLNLSVFAPPGPRFPRNICSNSRMFKPKHLISTKRQARPLK